MVKVVDCVAPVIVRGLFVFPVEVAPVVKEYLIPVRSVGKGVGFVQLIVNPVLVKVVIVGTAIGKAYNIFVARFATVPIPPAE
jgi:hypothetical protein